MEKSVLFLFKLIYQSGYSQHLSGEYKGDNRLHTWMIVDANRESKTVRFKSNRRMCFFYGIQLVHLEPGEYSRPYPGTSFTSSLQECHAKIDNIPIQVYYEVLKFEARYQNFVERAASLLSRDNSSAAEFENAIADCRDILNEIQKNREAVPGWFTREYLYDDKISLANACLEEAALQLTRKRSSVPLAC